MSDESVPKSKSAISYCLQMWTLSTIHNLFETRSEFVSLFGQFHLIVNVIAACSQIKYEVRNRSYVRPMKSKKSFKKVS